VHSGKFVILIFALLAKSLGFGQAPVYEDAADTLDNWIEQRITSAQLGIKEKVEMPFVVRTLGWGCMCPDYFIGVSPNVQEGPWISPIVPRKFPVSDTVGYSLIVTGHFTGKWVEIDLRNGEEEPDEWLYTVPEFKIRRWKANEVDYSVFPPRIID